MNRKIDMTFEFSKPDRAVLLLLTAAVLALVFFSETPKSQSAEVERGFQFTLYPWFTAGITVGSGLDVFSGLPLTPPTDGQRASMLLGLLLGIIVGPTLLLFSWRAARVHPGKPHSKLGFLIGGMLTYAIALPAVPTALMQWSNYESMQSAQAQGEGRDEVIFAVQLVLRDAKQYRILPASEGGGNGTFGGYTMPVGLSGNRFGNYEVLSRSDSVLVIKGVPTLNPRSATIATLTTGGSLTWKTTTN